MDLVFLLTKWKGLRALRFPLPARAILTVKETALSNIDAAPATLSSGAIALRLLRGQQGQVQATPKLSVAAAAERLQVEERLDQSFRLSARNAYHVAVESLHMTYATSAKLALAMERQGEAMAEATPQPLSQFAPEDAARLAALGADAAIEVPAIRLDDAAFADLVHANARVTMMEVPGFAEAWAAGEVKVQRMEEVPELGYAEKGFALFKDGNMIGGAGWGGLFNEDHYNKIAATGVQQGVGSVMGQGYYMTWGQPG